MKVGVIGLGTMGAPMAAALARAGHEVFAHDVDPRAVERAKKAGAQPAAGGAEVGASCRVVLLSLPRPEHVVEAVLGEDGVLSRPSEGLVVVDTSTVDPATTRRVAEEAAASGVSYLDAPVLGRPDACGRWTLPVGGDPDALEVARPALEAVAERVVPVGGAGAGHAIKLLNALMFGAINAITAEVFAAAPLVGVSPARFYEVVAGSEAATVSGLFRQLGPKILARDFDPTFTVDLLRKDNLLGMRMVEEAGASLVVGGAVGTLNGMAYAAGHGGEDTSAVVKVYERLLGEGDVGGPAGRRAG